MHYLVPVYMTYICIEIFSGMVMLRALYHLVR